MPLRADHKIAATTRPYPQRATGPQTRSDLAVRCGEIGLAASGEGTDPQAPSCQRVRVDKWVLESRRAFPSVPRALRGDQEPHPRAFDEGCTEARAPAGC